MKYTKKEISYGTPDRIEIPGGLVALIETKPDLHHGSPWDETDGHGEVSKPLRYRFGMGSKPPKKAGEKILYWKDGYFRTYDFAGAIKLAKRDGWGIGPDQIAQLAVQLGRAPTKGELAAASVQADFDYLRGWAEDEWQYLGVIVTLEDAEGNEIACDSLWGVEGRGDYWKEVAADMLNELLSQHDTETKERAYWESRDVETVEASR